MFDTDSLTCDKVPASNRSAERSLQSIGNPSSLGMPKDPPDTLPGRFLDHCWGQDTLGMVKLLEKMREWRTTGRASADW